jgi:hypothetical protein
MISSGLSRPNCTRSTLRSGAEDWRGAAMGEWGLVVSSVLLLTSANKRSGRGGRQAGRPSNQQRLQKVHGALFALHSSDCG